LVPCTLASVAVLAAQGSQHPHATGSAVITVPIQSIYDNSLELDNKVTINSPLGSDSTHPTIASTADASFNLEYSDLGGVHHAGPLKGPCVLDTHKGFKFEATAPSYMNATHNPAMGVNNGWAISEGAGKVNGVLGYRYKLIAYDAGNRTASGCFDLLRFQVWRTSDNVKVYDNMRSAPDNAPPDASTYPIKDDLHVHVS
jgi:hypothetical protein